MLKRPNTPDEQIIDLITELSDGEIINILERIFNVDFMGFQPCEYIDGVFRKEANDLIFFSQDHGRSFVLTVHPDHNRMLDVVLINAYCEMDGMTRADAIAEGRKQVKKQFRELLFEEETEQ